MFARLLSDIRMQELRGAARRILYSDIRKLLDINSIHSQTTNQTTPSVDLDPKPSCAARTDLVAEDATAAAGTTKTPLSHQAKHLSSPTSVAQVSLA